MYVLDTDHVTFLERGDSAEGSRLRERLRQLPPEERVTTILSFEEQVRGWMAVLAKSRSVAPQIEAYRRLKRLLEVYCDLVVLEFDELSATQWQRLQKSRIRISTSDLKIAAMALTHNATVLTRNLHDFRRVPGLKVEDWTT